MLGGGAGEKEMRGMPWIFVPDAAESSCPGWRNGGNVVGVERERTGI